MNQDVGRAEQNGALMSAQVHQASGVVSAQLGFSGAEALVKLKAYADAHGRGIVEVAADVMAGRLRFDGPAA
ncbi:ANTAR domain-containing protein [Catenulispora sp. GAS73]|uniref:ANTAR domain-containing protein n=1 Tax=Catenulispora sp. GAS73 TaxID=3156269 RepID=UPI003516AC52